MACIILSVESKRSLKDTVKQVYISVNSVLFGGGHIHRLQGSIWCQEKKSYVKIMAAHA